MSIYTGFQSIRRERAILERNRVLMTSMIKDGEISTAFENASNHDFFEDVSEAELEELISRIPESSPGDEDAEVERILTSNNELDVDGILGVEDSPGVEAE